MLTFVRDMAKARDMVDVNVAAGVARPRLARAAFLGLVSAVLFLSVSVALLWISYAQVTAHLSSQDRVLQQQSVMLDAMQASAVKRSERAQAAWDLLQTQIVSLHAEIIELRREHASR